MSKEKLLASAQKNLEKGQVGKAIKDYQKIIEADPKDIRNRQKLAELFGRERMKDEALKEYEAVARSYSDTGFYLKAIAVYRQMQRLDSGRPEIYLRLAELSEKQGLIGDAQSEYRNLSAYYEKNRIFSEQLKVLQKMRELEPENHNIRVKIIDCTLLVDSAENARKELLAFLDDLAADNDSARALKLYDFYLPKFPHDLRLLAGQAEVLIRKGEKSRGMQTLQDLLRKDPENADVLRILAHVYRHEGKHQEARGIYQRLLVRYPEDLEFREAYLRAGIEAGETASVRKDLDKWQPAFSDAGRSDLVQSLLAQLNGALPETTRSEMAIEAMAAPEQAQPVENAPQEPVEELEEIAELIEEAEEPEAELDVPADGEAEEVSLDFLEETPLDFLESSAPPVPEVQTPDVPPPAEVELELELDMELELGPVDVEPALEIAAGEDEPLDLDLDAEDFPEADVAHLPEIGEEAAVDYIDLSSEIAGEMDDAVLAASGEGLATTTVAKKRIKTGVEVEDPETHFNLGIAYKEMGLLDDAIGEFDKAMRAPERAVPCLILKGMCLLEKGERKKAEETLKAGLARTDCVEEDRISLHFELGELYESGERFSEALDCFKYVAERDRFHRNAGERVAALQQRLGLEADDDEGAAKAGGRKNRVSYV